MPLIDFARADEQRKNPNITQILGKVISSVIKKGFLEEGDVADGTHFRTFIV